MLQPDIFQKPVNVRPPLIPTTGYQNIIQLVPCHLAFRKQLAQGMLRKPGHGDVRPASLHGNLKRFQVNFPHGLLRAPRTCNDHLDWKADGTHVREIMINRRRAITIHILYLPYRRI